MLRTIAVFLLVIIIVVLTSAVSARLWSGDCFACGTCIETCPVKAVSFNAGKREVPPDGKFEKNNSNI